MSINNNLWLITKSAPPAKPSDTSVTGISWPTDDDDDGDAGVSQELLVPLRCQTSEPGLSEMFYQIERS